MQSSTCKCPRTALDLWLHSPPRPWPVLIAQVERTYRLNALENPSNCRCAAAAAAGPSSCASAWGRVQPWCRRVGPIAGRSFDLRLLIADLRWWRREMSVRERDEYDRDKLSRPSRARSCCSVLKLNRPSTCSDCALAERSKFMTAASAQFDKLSVCSPSFPWFSACKRAGTLAPSTPSPRLWLALPFSPGLPRASARASGCTNLLAEGGHVLGRTMRAERSRVLELSACDGHVRIRRVGDPGIKKPGRCSPTLLLWRLEGEGGGRGYLR
jgi:hypothetical protein